MYALALCVAVPVAAVVFVMMAMVLPHACAWAGSMLGAGPWCACCLPSSTPPFCSSLRRRGTTTSCWHSGCSVTRLCRTKVGAAKTFPEAFGSVASRYGGAHASPRPRAGVELLQAIAEEARLRFVQKAGPPAYIERLPTRSFLSPHQVGAKHCVAVVGSAP
jgi:hypothetical protein